MLNTLIFCGKTFCLNNDCNHPHIYRLGVVTPILSLVSTNAYILRCRRDNKCREFESHFSPLFSDLINVVSGTPVSITIFVI